MDNPAQLARFLGGRSPVDVAKRLSRPVIWVLALDAFGRQVGALFVLIILRRTFYKLRRIKRTLWRSVSCLFSAKAQRARQLRSERRRCLEYETFRKLGEQLDDLAGLTKWKHDEQSHHYSASLLKERTEQYQRFQANGDVQSCMFALRTELLRKHFGICNPALFDVCTSGTKLVIEKYVSTVCETMQWVAFSHRESSSEQLSSDEAPAGKNGAAGATLEKSNIHEKLAFFTETKRSFGSSALLLSGGASLGMYHFGVVKALHRNGLLPQVIAGTSAGSIVCACIGTRTDDELMQMWSDDFKWEEHFNLNFFNGPNIGHFFRSGTGLFSMDHFAKALKENIGDCTFLEAYDRTGRICNVTVSGLRGSTRYPMLLNYLTGPHVLIWSAVAASCALPGVFEPHELLAKTRKGDIVPYLSAGLKWQDGSMQSDLPMSRLSELFNINYFIVSQVNPQAPLLTGGGVGSPHGPIFRASQFLRREIKQYMLSLAELSLGTGGTRVSPFFRPVGYTPVGLIAQEYQGDVTIFNGGGFASAHKLLQNGCEEQMRQYTAESQWETWWFIPQIQNACAIEFFMDRIIKDLRAELLTMANSVGLANELTAPLQHGIMSDSYDSITLLQRLISHEVSAEETKDESGTARPRTDSRFTQAVSRYGGESVGMVGIRSAPASSTSFPREKRPQRRSFYGLATADPVKESGLKRNSLSHSFHSTGLLASNQSLLNLLAADTDI